MGALVLLADLLKQKTSIGTEVMVSWLSEKVVFSHRRAAGTILLRVELIDVFSRISVACFLQFTRDFFIK